MVLLSSRPATRWRRGGRRELLATSTGLVVVALAYCCYLLYWWPGATTTGPLSTKMTTHASLSHPPPSQPLLQRMLARRYQHHQNPLTRPFHHLVICSRELEHLTVGGAGVVVADTARALTLSGRWRVTVVLDVPSFKHDDQHHRRLETWHVNAANSWAATTSALAIKSVLSNLRLVPLADLLLPLHRQKQQQLTSNAPLYWRNSVLWAQGLQGLYAREPFDAVEFFDYEAPAYHTLLWRHQQNNANINNFLVWIRTHGLLQSIDRVENKDQTEYLIDDRLEYVYRMETRALQLADAVIANSAAIGDAYARKHHLDALHRAVAIPPTLGTLEAYAALRLSHSGSPPKQTTPTTSTNILVYGKLQRVKGADVAARAIVQVMQRLQSAWQGVAIFAGDDLPCATDASVNMSTCIQRLIVPPELHHRFQFTGSVKRGEIGAVAAANRVRMAILPSRYETFCLAAHEVKHFRVPLVLPDLPAYRDFFVDGDNALLFEAGSTTDLARVLERGLTDNDVLTRIMRAPQLDYGDPVEGYERLLRNG